MPVKRETPGNVPMKGFTADLPQRGYVISITLNWRPRENLGKESQTLLSAVGTTGEATRASGPL